jgi:hypothetical protein
MRYVWVLIPALWLAWWLRGEHSAPGVLVPESPIQRTAALPEWQHDGFRIRALAEYRIRGRILSREHYWLDGGARISPFDLALGWGSMSDQAVLDKFYWGQGHRFLNWYSPSGPPPLPFEEFNSQIANMHIVPATAAVRSVLEWTRAGGVVTLSGHLIEVEGPHGFKWRSSLSRTDSGAGACELMWVGEAVRD